MNNIIVVEEDGSMGHVSCTEHLYGKNHDAGNGFGQISIRPIRDSDVHMFGAF